MGETEYVPEVEPLADPNFEMPLGNEIVNALPTKWRDLRQRIQAGASPEEIRHAIDGDTRAPPLTGYTQPTIEDMQNQVSEVYRVAADAIEMGLEGQTVHDAASRLADQARDLRIEMEDVLLRPLREMLIHGETTLNETLNVRPGGLVRTSVISGFAEAARQLRPNPNQIAENTSDRMQDPRWNPESDDE